MRVAFKLLVALLVLHAVYRVGTAYWQHYAFEDAVQQTIQFAGEAPTEEVSASVLTLADEHDIPLEPDALVVTRDRRQVRVEATYSRDVEVLPRYARPFRFTLDASAFQLN